MFSQLHVLFFRRFSSATMRQTIGYSESRAKTRRLLNQDLTRQGMRVNVST